MRVHELAKAVQMESKDILAIAKKHRIAIKASPSANVEDKDIRKMMPLIDKFKAESKAREEDDRKRKDDERKAKEEERRRKEEERKKELEAKRKTDEESARRAEESARTATQRKAEEDRKARSEAAKAQREEEKRRDAEDERLRSLGLRVPKRPAAFRPKTEDEIADAAAAAAPPPAPAPAPAAPAPQAGTAPRPGAGTGIRPGGGTGIRPGGGTGQGPRPGGGTGYQGQGGSPRPGGFDRDRQGPAGPRPAGGGYQGQGGPGGPRPAGGGYQGQGGQRPGGYQGQGGPGGPRPGGYQGQGGPGGPRPAGGGYQGGQRPGGYQGQGGPGGQRPGGYQGQGGPGGPRPAGGGYQGGPGGQRGPGGPPRGDRPYPPRQDGGGGYGRRDEGRTGPAELSEGNLPQIGVMRLDKPAGRARTDRDRKPPVAADKKRSKLAPRKIFELDEDMTMTARPKVPGVGRAPGGGGDTRPAFGGRRRMGKRPKSRSDRQHRTVQDTGPRQVTIEGPVTVSQFAEKLGISATDIIRKVLLDMGEALTMNATLSEELMLLLAPDFNAELEIIPVGDEFDVEQYLSDDAPERMQRRPPVVTIMGHVDHGKTSLLDYIRSSKVVQGEFGGITQHIGAYHVDTAKGPIVFLDTPGHEAFTSMRARGAGVTDLVILVVAANDGFKPQTIEALNHAKAAQVPLVVAVNKIDLPGADPAKVRQEALQHSLISEELGGDTIFVDISAKQGTNVDQLLEMVALQSEILDLKADPDRAAVGTIIESHVDPTRGAVATVLVQKGTLKAGDYFVTGDISGRVRAMVNDRGKTVKEAGPSFPAEIIGLTGSPAAGETFIVLPDEQTARNIAEKREIRRRAAGLAPTTQKHITLEHLHEYIEEGKTQDLNLVLKADVQGSIEAVRQSLEKLSNQQIRIRVLHAAVGGINESDVQLAAASDAVIIGFNVRPEAAAQEIATREGVDIKLYRIIYDLIEEVRQAMTGMLAPTFREKVLGHAEVRQLFKASRLGTIAGSYVRDGEIVRDSKVRIVRDSVVVYEGQLGSLRRVKEDVKKVATGAECGITIENFNDLKEGDIVESYEMEQMATLLQPANA